MFGENTNILIIDDEQAVCELLVDGLTGSEGYLCSTAFTGDQALRKIGCMTFDVIILDIGLPDISGLTILDMIISAGLDTAVIMLTGVDDIAVAVEAMKTGAVDYVLKPFTLNQINQCIKHILTNRCVPTLAERHRPSEPSDKELFREIDAIAVGIEARHELISGQTKVIIRETARVAEQLGVADRVIQKWIRARERTAYHKRHNVEFLMEKLKRSAQGQELMGLMKPYKYVGDGRIFESNR